MSNLSPLKRFNYALLFLVNAVCLVVAAIVAFGNIVNANKVDDSPKVPVDSRAEPLRRAIITQLSILGESTVHYSGNTCTRTIDVTSEDSDTSLDDTPFTCLITAESGNTYEAEISLLKMGDAWYELPAFFTLKNQGENL